MLALSIQKLTTDQPTSRAQPSQRQPPVYMDLASLGALPKYTCGQLYYYAAFAPRRDAQRLAHDVRHNLTRPTAWEARSPLKPRKTLERP